jgi:soluble lytic murein transglycosylase-like protein
MAAKPATPEIRELIARGEAARARLTSTVLAVRAKLDAPARVRQSLRAHPTAWLAGAVATGLVTSRLIFRRRPRKSMLSNKSSSIPVFLLKLAFNAVSPALKIWLLAQAKSWLNRRVSPHESIQSR